LTVTAQIYAPGPKPFTAGIVLRDDRVIEAAPIVRYMVGWKRSSVRSYCKERRWIISVVSEKQT